MDIIGKLVSECKTLAQTEEDLRNELFGLKGQLLIEEQNLALLRKDQEKLHIQSSNIKQSIESGQQQVEFLKSMRDSINKSSLIYSFLDKLIINAEPTDEQQENQYNVIQHEYIKLLKQYEESPEYLQILEAEAKDRELTQLINEKQNELMKLETEREF